MQDTWGMNMQQRLLVSTIVFSSLLLSAGDVNAQATTCNLPNPSCSSLAATCKTFNRKLGADTSRCDGYKAECLRTGAWRDRNCSRDNVARK